jgi:hypothetical protein
VKHEPLLYSPYGRGDLHNHVHSYYPWVIDPLARTIIPRRSSHNSRLANWREILVNPWVIHPRVQWAPNIRSSLGTFGFATCIAVNDPWVYQMGRSGVSSQKIMRKRRSRIKDLRARRTLGKMRRTLTTSCEHCRFYTT